MAWGNLTCVAGLSTISRALSGAGRCSTLASDHDALIHASISCSVVRITGMAFSWTEATRPFGLVVIKPYSSWSDGPSFTRLTPCQGVHRPAKKNRERSGRANQTFLNASLGVLAGRRAGFRKAGHRDNATIADTDILLPMPIVRVADIGRAAVRVASHPLRRSWHSACQVRKLPHPIRSVAHHRAGAVRVDVYRWLKVAENILNALDSALMASWVVVRLYRLHMATATGISTR